MKQFDIYYKKNLRKTVEGILFRLRTGCQWADILSCFGKANSIYQSCGHPIDFIIMAGKVNDMVVALNLLEQLDLSHNETVCVDREFDSDAFRK